MCARAGSASASCRTTRCGRPGDSATRHFSGRKCSLAFPLPVKRGEGGEQSEPGERLSWLSSALPSGVVADHGVEDGEELAHHGREGELFGFSGGGQPLVERLEGGI